MSYWAPAIFFLGCIVSVGLLPVSVPLGIAVGFFFIGALVVYNVTANGLHNYILASAAVIACGLLYYLP